MTAPTQLSVTNLWGVPVEFRIADGNTGNATLHTDHDPSNDQYVYEFYYNGSPGGPGLTLIFKNATSDSTTGFGTAYTGYQFVDLNLGQQPSNVFHHVNGKVQMNFSSQSAEIPASDISFFNNYTPNATQTHNNQGGGTNTGSIVYNPTNSYITLTIDSTSESDATIDYKVTWLKGTTVYTYGPYAHTLGAADSYNISSNDPLNGTWTLYTDAGNNSYTTLDEVIVGGSSNNPSSNSSRRKVFGNFW